MAAQVDPSSTPHRNRSTLARLAVVAVVMFGFGYAMVPFYKKFCEIAGVNNLLQPDRPAANTQVDRSRSVTVEFDANIHDLPWRFRPLQAHVVAHPGELMHVEYEVTNTRNHPVSGQAIPSYGPAVAGRYFQKMECFCFTRQTLAPGETRRMPVVFVVDPSLPADMETVTLSYTFFEIAGTGVRVAAPTAEPRG